MVGQGLRRGREESASKLVAIPAKGWQVRYVNIRFDAQGTFIDPKPYLALLDGLKTQLPAGARAFIDQPGHFHFGDHCLHDMMVRPTTTNGELRFGWPTRPDVLRIFYDDSVAVTTVAEPGAGRPDAAWEVIYDEILPSTAGCCHEIVCYEGTLRIDCTDLHATWAMPE